MRNISIILMSIFMFSCEPPSNAKLRIINKSDDPAKIYVLYCGSYEIGTLDKKTDIFIEYEVNCEGNLEFFITGKRVAHQQYGYITTGGFSDQAVLEILPNGATKLLLRSKLDNK